MAHELLKAAVDPVIFTISGDVLKVCLREREKEPYKGMFELPGGLLDRDETAEDVLARKLHELFSTPLFFEQYKTFTAPDRDPRERTISIGYIALIDEEKASPTLSWHAVNALPKMAFDHEAQVRAAHEYLKSRLDSQLIKHFLPKVFPLNKLQEIHEVVRGVSLDNRNFRKQLLASQLVRETKEYERGVSHRPAKLYQFM